MGAGVGLQPGMKLRSYITAQPKEDYYNLAVQSHSF